MKGKETGKRALLSSTAKGHESVGNALRCLGLLVRDAEEKRREGFNRLKRACNHREPYEPQPRIYICKKIKRMWHVWPCKMKDCPLLKGEL